MVDAGEIEVGRDKAVGALANSPDSGTLTRSVVVLALYFHSPRILHDATSPSYLHFLLRLKIPRTPLPRASLDDDEGVEDKDSVGDVQGRLTEW